MSLMHRDVYYSQPPVRRHARGQKPVGACHCDCYREQTLHRASLRCICLQDTVLHQTCQAGQAMHVACCSGFC